ncbi:PaaI family thioesterase [Paenibacillus dendritiformis]|uniref:hotdog fold thioesterase n=1 Tax=Paenibacillus dendritiformis TaxID=130049 RepID=UPI00143D555D|nr:PaaI family thioesterase [Paenibacillus dendritiformis]NRF98318.1 PaaI family thioesterase [Paenibacillus dendritiformis]
MSQPTRRNRFNDLLGIEVVQLQRDGCVMQLHIRPDLHNSLEGVVHGGVTNTLADVAMGHAAVPPVDGVQQCVTVESKINYLSPAIGELLVAESRVLKRGRNLIVTDVRITCDGKLVAVASGTYARINPERVERGAELPAAEQAKAEDQA